MKIVYSKAFIKAASKLTGKYKVSLKNMIDEVKIVATVHDLLNCKKLEGFNNSYRIRLGSYRVFFIVTIENNTACFEYLVSRGDAYSKKFLKSLTKKDID